MNVVDTICIDVDGTLLLWPGDSPGDPGKYLQLFYNDEFEPDINHALVKRIKSWYNSGQYDIILWSARGRAHATRAARYAQINHFLNHKCAKPTLLVDDHTKWFARIQMLEPNKL